MDGILWDLCQTCCMSSPCRCRSICPQQSASGGTTARNQLLFLSCPSLSAPVPPAASPGRARPSRTVTSARPSTAFLSVSLSVCACVDLPSAASPHTQDTNSGPPSTRTVRPTASPRRSHWTPASDQRRRFLVKRPFYTLLDLMDPQGAALPWFRQLLTSTSPSSGFDDCHSNSTPTCVIAIMQVCQTSDDIVDSNTSVMI